MVRCSLRETTINDTSTWWIHGFASPFIKHEEALVDPLVHENHSNQGLVSNFVVQLLNSFLELLDLELDDLVTLSISNTVSVDYKICWVFSGMVLSKALHRIR